MHDDSYTLALHRSKTSEMSRILQLNRSLANLKLRRYDEALEDAGKLTADEQQSEKGFYRAALSLYELGKFQECHQALASLIQHYPHGSAAKKEIIRTKQRLKEQEHGDYDFRAMYKAAEDTPPCLDNATFAVNVEVQASNGRGRGLFAKKDVIAGDLLLCDKAFAYCSSTHSKLSVLMNTHTNRGTMGTQADLITAIAQKVFWNPSLKPIFTSLYHGDYTPVDETEVDGISIIDTYIPPTPIPSCSANCHAVSSSNASLPSIVSAALAHPSKTTPPSPFPSPLTTTQPASSSKPPTSTTAATAMPDAASSATCKSSVLPALSQQAQKSSSTTLSQSLMIRTNKHRRGYRIGAFSARALSACIKRKQRRMC